MRALKEAVPVPVEIVMAWELGVLEHESKEPLKAILYWQLAIMAYASMRFDDALHTSPALTTERRSESSSSAGRRKSRENVVGQSWQFGSESLSGLPWLFTGLDVLKRTAPESYLKEIAGFSGQTERGASVFPSPMQILQPC